MTSAFTEPVFLDPSHPYSPGQKRQKVESKVFREPSSAPRAPSDVVLARESNKVIDNSMKGKSFETYRDPPEI
jgi:hypothetical protein